MTAIPYAARKRKSTKIFELKSVFAVNYVGRDLGTARVNHLLPLTNITPHIVRTHFLSSWILLEYSAMV